MLAKPSTNLADEPYQTLKVTGGESPGGEVIELLDGHFMKVKTAKGKVCAEPHKPHLD